MTCSHPICLVQFQAFNRIVYIKTDSADIHLEWKNASLCFCLVAFHSGWHLYMQPHIRHVLC